MADIKKLTLEEMAGLLSGQDKWRTKSVSHAGITSVFVADGPHGLRRENNPEGAVIFAKSEPATCFPTAALTGCSFDPALIREMARAMGAEARNQGVDVLLGPGINIKRTPLCGRNFEYFSEDPFIAGVLGTAYVLGLKDMEVGASLKHYCCNNRENQRFIIDTIVDERALREIYLAGFERVVREAQPDTVMCSYNKLNGEYLSESRRLLTGILRDEWGFKGIVVSDWGAVSDRVQGVIAGLDLEMPGNGGINDAEIVRAVQAGRLHVEDVERCAERIADFSEKFPKREPMAVDYEANNNLARRVAAESIVLLKNDGILPLKKGKRIAVIGELARNTRIQGGGSSKVNPRFSASFLDALDAEGVKYDFSKGYTLDSSDRSAFAEAILTAERAGIAVFCAGLADLDEQEGYDRTDIKLPKAQADLLYELSIRVKTVVLLFSGSALETDFSRAVSAILYCGLPGQAGAYAVSDILYGEVNPSGKLAETFPVSLADCPAYSLINTDAQNYVAHRESIFVGYRYYQTFNRPVAYPFGHGLSYTEFRYSGLTVLGANGEYKITARIKNTGLIAGKEAAQLYIRDTAGTMFLPDRELKGICKLHLEPGGEGTAEFNVTRRDFMHYNPDTARWELESGVFEILVGSSSTDIRLTSEVEIEGESKFADRRAELPAYYLLGEFGAVEFARLLRKAEEFTPRENKKFTEMSTIRQIQRTMAGRIMKKKLSQMIAAQLKKKEGDREFDSALNTLLDMPIRKLSLMSDGAFPLNTAQGIIHLSNHRYLKALRAFKSRSK